MPLIDGICATCQFNGNAVGSAFTCTANDLLNNGITSRPHVQIGVVFTDNSGAAVTPGAGTYTITAETFSNPGVFQAIYGATGVDATAALQTYSMSGCITRIRVTPTGITTATKFNVNLTASIS